MAGGLVQRVRANLFGRFRGEVRQHYLPDNNWERKNKKHSAIAGVQNVPGAFKRRLITRRIALSTLPLTPVRYKRSHPSSSA